MGALGMSGSEKTANKSINIEMPQLSSPGDDEGGDPGATLASWLVGVGDAVTLGEVIAELETDKATLELESPATGAVLALEIAAGTEGILPGAVLGSISMESAGESPGANAPPDRAGADECVAKAAESAQTAPQTASAGAAQAEAVASDGAKPEVEPRRATPLARRAAEANDVRVEELAGTGLGGRVVEADVLRAADGSGEAPAHSSPKASAPVVEALVEGDGFRSERLSAMRKTIARRLTESKQQVPHFYLRTRVAMDELLRVRAQLNAGLAEEGRETKISVNDFILRATALALRDVPAANVQYAETAMRVFDRVDISVAVATDGGLVTPVVRNADLLGLTALGEEVKLLAGLARSGKLKPEQYQGGTITISNLGMYGIETVYPILNPPQACILGIGAAEEQPVVRDGEIVVGRVAAITLAADHRAVDGAVGAEFLSALRGRLEDPLGMML